VETGFPAADSRDDFARARRNAVLARLAARLRMREGDVDVLLPFDEVVAALGHRGEQNLGLQSVDLDAIVGSVDRRAGFDRQFRPTSDLTRSRFERLALAVRRGADLPPIELYRVGEVHFVRDGHHRVAVLRALGREMVAARVTLVRTAMSAGSDLRMGDLPLKGHERLFRERIPLPPAIRDRVVFTDADHWPCYAKPACTPATGRWTPRSTCGSHESATTCCARTAGTTRSSHACSCATGASAADPLRAYASGGRASASPVSGSNRWIRLASSQICDSRSSLT